jgi:hypothetical protein
LPVILPAPDLPAGPRSALVIATGMYADERLAALRAPARDARDLAAVLADPAVGGFAVEVLSDLAVHDLRLRIDHFLAGRTTRETVVVYLSCHGVLSARRRLYFAATDTRRDRLASTGLEARWLIECLDECPARRQVVVLDCCFSGAFALTKSGRGPQDVGLEQEFGLPQGRGRVVLTASRATEFSFEGESLDDGRGVASVFTSALVRGLRTGAADADGDGLVSASEAYAFAYKQVRAAGSAQTPQHWVYGGEGEVVLARSAAGVAVEPAPVPEELRAGLDSRYPGLRAAAVQELSGWLDEADPRRVLAARAVLEEIAVQDVPKVARAARAALDKQQSPVLVAPDPGGPPPQAPGPGRASRGRGTEAPTLRARAAAAFRDAEELARTVADGSARVVLLAEVARALAGADPGRAARLFAEAEGVVQTMAAGFMRQAALAELTQISAAADPDQAERLAGTITGEGLQAWALAEVARALVPGDVDRAMRTAGLIKNVDARTDALTGIGAALAAADPGTAALAFEAAHDSARAIADESGRVWALARLAGQWAAADPAGAARLFWEAERMAWAVRDEFTRGWALAGVARALAATDPDRAERTAREIADESTKANALSAIARELAAADLGRAERLAGEITGESAKANAWSAIARVLAATDPDRAEHIAREIADESAKAYALSAIAQESAVADPDRAERIARSITDGAARARALAGLAQCWAAEGPETEPG